MKKGGYLGCQKGGEMKERWEDGCQKGEYMAWAVRKVGR